MKANLLFILLICTSLKAQTTHNQSAGNQLDYFKSNLNDLKDDSDKNINNFNESDSIVLNGDTTLNNFGYSVSDAGDVNGDGYSDLIVCSKPHPAKAYIFYGGAKMDNFADVLLEYNCYSVSSAGDVNGDGYSDVIIGHIEIAYIFYGGTIMDNIPDVTLRNVSGEPEFFGLSVSSAGDLNGDGYSDVIVGAPLFSGRVYIFYGGVNMNNVPDVIMTGGANIYFGGSVSSAGDVNGDGYSDVMVSAYQYNSNTGRTYIYYGGLSMNNVADVIMTGEANGNSFGNSVSSAGDVNNDGYYDVIVGAPEYNSYTGRTYIYYGGLSMNNVADVIMTGTTTSNNFGCSVSTAGDVNGDGYSDVIVGASGYNNAKGRTFIFYGGLSMDINADVTMTGEDYNNFFGASVSTAGDVNGDGFSDVIVGTYGYNNDKGRAYVYMSKPSLRIKLKVLVEGMYSPLYNLLARKDSVTLLLRDVTSPFTIRDSAKFVIDSLTFSKQFPFYNAPPGNYYIVAKHFNCIETWSKAGGENLVSDTAIYYYDFTIASSQAFGNNLKLKGAKYCIYSGDVNQDGFISLSDVIPVYNDASGFVTGRFIKTDLTGDNIVDLTDVTLCYNNSTSFVRVIRP